MFNQEKFTAIGTHQTESFFRLTHEMFEAVNKINQLNNEVVKSNIDASKENVVFAMKVKTMHELAQAGSDKVAPLVEQASTYNGHLQDIILGVTTSLQNYAQDQQKLVTQAVSFMTEVPASASACPAFAGMNSFMQSSQVQAMAKSFTDSFNNAMASSQKVVESAVNMAANKRKKTA